MSIHNIDREEIKPILTQDSHYRKAQKWPLLSSESFNLIKHHKNIGIIKMLNVKHEKETDNIKININNFVENINNKFRFINDVLDKFRGHLVVCGGSIVNTIFRPQHQQKKHTDIDLFFYDLNIEEANKMRISVICEIINNWKSRWDGEKYIVKRNEFVSSIYIFYDDVLLVEYQLIHRIYPDISSIIGGFDIGACMLAYDGHEIYATPLGAWSLRNRSIIVDTKRRSTSYEHRLVKYFKRGFRIIFPGLKNEDIKYKKVIGCMSESEEILKSRIFNLITECGYKVNNINNIMKECSKFQKLSDDNMSPDNLAIIRKYDNNILSLTQYHNKTLSEKSLNKISDYYNLNGMNFNYFITANITKLRLGNLKAVSSLIVIDDPNKQNNLFLNPRNAKFIHDNFYNDIYDMLVKDVSNPDLQLNEQSIEEYKDKIERIKTRFITSKSVNQQNDNFYELMRGFGHLTNEVLKIKNVYEYDYYRDVMIKVMKDNTKICEKKLIGIKWITKNPGRQWTSSINPIVANPREWYGDDYIPIVTGIPVKIESCLRLISLSRTESYWSLLPTEIFNLILFYISKNYADNAWQYITD